VKTTFVAILLVALTAGAAFSTPSRSMNQRRVEKKRDASKAAPAAPAQAQAASPSKPASTPARPAPAPAASNGQPSTPAPAAEGTNTQAQPAPAATEPATSSGRSLLTREGKPPSSRFFSRVRTDASRDYSKARREAAAAQTGPEAQVDANHIYRRTWGPRSHRRPR
jgi:hypothetical protein